MRSIMHKKDGTCYLCMKKGFYGRHLVLEEHHVFGGPNRKLSEKYGLKVYLCLNHHRIGPEAVHGSQANMTNKRLLQQMGQQYFRVMYGDGFEKIFGRNYL